MKTKITPIDALPGHTYPINRYEVQAFRLEPGQGKAPKWRAAWRNVADIETAREHVRKMNAAGWDVPIRIVHVTGTAIVVE